jgi:glycosyltransferase involved in cell wall biosynthesis
MTSGPGPSKDGRKGYSAKRTQAPPPAVREGPRVSVVIIFWNAEAFLGEAVDSVFEQAYADWELLLVDDGSTDGSTAIAHAAIAREPERTRYLEHPGHANQGMSASRNLGIRHARGEYLAFLDADDTLSPATLAEQVPLLDAEPRVALVYGPILWWYSWTGSPADHDRDRVEDLGVPPDATIEPPRLLPLILRDRAAVPSGILVRRSVAQRVGLFEDRFRGEYEDQVFLAKVCLSEPVYASSRCWYRYRQHAGSAVATGLRTGATEAARLTFLRWLARYLEAGDVRDPGVRYALRVELLRSEHPRLHSYLASAGWLRGGARSMIARSRRAVR